MQLSFLRPLYDRPGPWCSVYLDASAGHRGRRPALDLRWRALQEELTDQGADEATVAALDRVVRGHEPMRRRLRARRLRHRRPGGAHRVPVRAAAAGPGRATARCRTPCRWSPSAASRSPGCGCWPTAPARTSTASAPAGCPAGPRSPAGRSSRCGGCSPAAGPSPATSGPRWRPGTTTPATARRRPRSWPTRSAPSVVVVAGDVRATGDARRPVAGALAGPGGAHRRGLPGRRRRPDHARRRHRADDRRGRRPADQRRAGPLRHAGGRRRGAGRGRLGAATRPGGHHADRGRPVGRRTSSGSVRNPPRSPPTPASWPRCRWPTRSRYAPTRRWSARWSAPTRS